MISDGFKSTKNGQTLDCSIDLDNAPASKFGDVTILLKKGRGGGKIKRTVEGDKNGHGKSKVSILWE